MIRGKGSDQARKTDDNYTEQQEFKASLKKQRIIPLHVPSVTVVDQSTKNPIAETPQNGHAAKKKEKPPAPEKFTRLMHPAEITPTGLSTEIGELDKHMKKIRAVLAENVPPLMVVYSLGDFYYSAIDTIRHIGSTIKRSPENLLSPSRAQMEKTEKIDHKDIVAKFDEAKEVLKQTKNVSKSVELIVEATAMCEKELMQHRHSVAFTPAYMTVK